MLKIFWRIIAFAFLTIITQIGGLAYLISLFLCRRIRWFGGVKTAIIFSLLYLASTFLVVPFIAPLFGREKVKHSDIIRPTNFMTVVLNRNYVRPDLNTLLAGVEEELKGTGITINYLDANLPFLDGFPLLPHLSHNDGKKLDLSLIYETPRGEISDQQKSVSGYGVYEAPKTHESNQIQKCLDAGYFQYDYPKYMTFGTKNKDLKFSEKGTSKLIHAILQQKGLGKLFIEPHLKERLNLKDGRVRYHGCRAVRHDDHIHIQL